MSNEITLVIIGIYTVVYVIVFIIQKNQIDRTKEINNSMKSFMDIFKIDEVKKYVELKNERIMMQAEKLVTDDEKIREISTEAIRKNTNALKEIYYNQMGEEHIELVQLAIKEIKSQPEENRLLYIEENLPKTKRYFSKMLEDINKGEL